MNIDGLRAVSARIGADPLLVQGAGGNTSQKTADMMMIKASGFWLSDALSKDMFVPLNLSRLQRAIAEGDPRAGSAVDFVIQGENRPPLRPSIETCVHAIFEQKYVVHVHCVRTLSFAVLADGEAELTRRLDGLEWIFIPYARPGLPLIPAISERKNANTEIVVLGNHGLIVAGDSLEKTEALLSEVQKRLGRPDPENHAPGGLEEICAGSAYAPAQEWAIHALAFDPQAIEIAVHGPLYPDHVIFLGPKTGLSASGPLPQTLREPMIIVPQKGVVLAKGLNAGARALARCLVDVLLRLPQNANPHFLGPHEIADLTGWDAEKYRQKLNLSAS